MLANKQQVIMHMSEVAGKFSYGKFLLKKVFSTVILVGN